MITSEVDKFFIVFLSTVEGMVHIRLTKKVNSGMDKKSLDLKHTCIINKNVLEELKQKFFENMGNESRLEFLKNLRMKKRKDISLRSKKIFNSDTNKTNLKLKIEKNVEIRERIKEADQKLKSFWRNKYEVKNGFYTIYKTLKDDFMKKQSFMTEWLCIINTHKVLAAIKQKHDDLTNHRASLLKLKNDCFKLWKNSKKTARLIKKQHDIKILKSVIRYSYVRYKLKQPVLKIKAGTILQKLFTKIFTIKLFERQLKEFTLRG